MDCAQEDCPQSLSSSHSLPQEGRDLTTQLGAQHPTGARQILCSVTKRVRLYTILRGLPHGFKAVQIHRTSSSLSSLLSRSVQRPGCLGTDGAPQPGWERALGLRTQETPSATGGSHWTHGLRLRGHRVQVRGGERAGPRPGAEPHLPTVATLAILASPVYPVVPHKGWLVEEERESLE